MTNPLKEKLKQIEENFSNKNSNSDQNMESYIFPDLSSLDTNPNALKMSKLLEILY
jgi:hypothetical protein